MKHQDPGALDAAMQKYLDDELMQAALAQVNAARRDSMPEQDRRPSAENYQEQAECDSGQNQQTAAREEFRQTIIDIAAGVLKIPQAKMDAKENMARYGVDSIIVTEIIKRISDVLALPIAPTIFFEARNLHELADILFTRYRSRIMQRYEDSHDDAGDAAPITAAFEAQELDTADVDDEVAGWIAKFQAISTAAHPVEPITAEQAVAATQHAAGENAYEAIAVIAMEGQFADSANLDEFERHLRQGDDCISEVPAERWDWQAVFGDPKLGEFTHVKYGGFIPDIDKFDPLFFGMSPKEAELMDPQHRLFIQCVWKLIESAGYAPPSFSDKKIGLFLGINLQDYAHIIDRSGAMEALHLTSLGHMFCPNRISFLLNIHGPSQVIDTACSSSLVALHRAILSIQHEGCEMAIAGGANLLISPDMHIMYSKVGMICEDGRCKTFSRQANGYVRGDGIGAVLLKRLSQAEKDGDTILGVIRGSAENHGGMSTSLTAPNPKAQASLIVDAHKKANIDPRSIGYIECHGTGTPLGDPIEINGLKMAFEKRHLQAGYALPDAAYCGLGSVKSNIGHAETAAGIAGVIKVLLAMKHKRLYPSLHCDDINPLIELEHSPFYIVQQGRDWQRPVIDGKEYPRRAGVNSFGAGGSNAHVVIEEYIDGRPAIPPLPRPALIVLSAKNEKRLRELAENLYGFLAEDNRSGTVDLADVAYTLQVGRAAMEERWAAVVESGAELQQKLKAFVESSDGINAMYRGNSKRDKDARVSLNTEILEPGFSAATIKALAERWVSGIPVDWEALYADDQDRRPRRISLPTYPFARQRYWIPTGTRIRDAAVRALHPLLHQNTSLLAEQRFSSNFTGKEFFLADHLMMGEKILPGVAYLEMARAAAYQSTLDLQGDRYRIRLKQVVWVSPYAVSGDQPAPLHIGLYPEANKQISYRIYSQSEDGGEKTVHSQGIAIRDTVTDQARAVLDLAGLQHNITGGKSAQNSLGKAQCYAAFKALAMDYGPGLQGIETLYFGEPDASPQVLAKLGLPAGVADTLDQYALHPSLMDSALQACIGLMPESVNTANGAGGSSALKAALPFALQELEITEPCEPAMWAWIRYAEGSAVTDKVQKLDIDLCDEQGRVCVRMKGFSSRVVDADTHEDKVLNTLMCQPVWQTAAVPDQSVPAEYARHLVMLYGLDAILPETVGSQSISCLRLQSSAKELAEQYQDIAIQVFTTIKVLLDQKPNGQVLIQVLLPGRGEQALFCGLSGLLKSAARENPKILGQIIEVDAAETAAALVDKITENSRAPEDAQIRYRNANREVLDWREMPVSSGSTSAIWKDNGVYLITGGAGGLGTLFAGEIAEKTQDAALILTGRSPLSEDRLKALKAIGANIEYRQVDVSQAAEVDVLVQDLLKSYGRIDGILHSAGVLRDNFIVKKTAQEFNAVFAPKVAGTVNLDRATQRLDLDFFVLFSSVAGALGSAGQADYAAANAFMDAFAAYRNERGAAKERYGLTLAVNWPLWKEGGMRMDAAAEAMMKAATGMMAMQTHTGLNAFYRMLASGQSQVMVMEGAVARMKQQLLARPKRLAQAATISIDKDILVNKIRQALLQMVSTTMKFELDDLDVETELSEYGFDSISFTDFANKLNQKYKLELAPTVFFEHPTIADIAGYLGATHQAAFVSAFGLSVKADVPVQTDQAELPTEPARQYARFSPGPTMQVPHAELDDAVAIIGISGRFPMAEDLDAFWENLKAGRDCISEIPKDRWDWQAIYGDPNKERNKTNIKWGGFIDGIGDFDAQFFGISPREAELMDPQQRLLMEYVWKAIEDGGYSPQSLSGSKTALFIGTASSGYGELMAKTGIAIDGYSATGVVGSVGPNRMSYFLNLHGPSEPIETACSSSLVAIHRALLAIRNGDCEQAIVGGINLIVSPETQISFNKAGMLCQDGRCKTFSRQANGYVRGEGVGMLFLKKLAAAEQAGDPIYAVIRGSAENHGGRANSLTAPNPKAQAELLKTAYSRAGIDPRTIGYIEAHGTGTELGDPIEISALKTAFKDLYQATGDTQVASAHCGLGSVKTNIGHLELAAGVAGVIKVLLQLKHKTLTKSLHCDEVNPYIRLQDTPFYLVRENREWSPLHDEQGRAYPRRAGISSFGFGGVNAHLVIEEYPEPDAAVRTDQMQPCLIVLSAKDPERLKDYAHKLLAFIRQDGQLSRLQKSATESEQKIRALISEILRVDAAEIGIEDSFVDYGLDAVQQTILLEKLQETFDIQIPAGEFRDKDTIALIAEELGRICSSEHKSSAVVALPLSHGHKKHPPALADLAYTLQVGRVAMEERLAFIAGSLQEFEEKLSRFLGLGPDGLPALEGQHDSDDWYVGQAKQNKDILAAFAADEELQEAVDKWIQRRKFSKLLSLWVKGLAVDWNTLYGDVKPKRVSLPTYPFAREHYWIRTENSPAQTQVANKLHPLVHQNVSTFYEQCFKTVFTGDEFFLADHRIQGQRVLPGVAYLEMARAAAEYAIGGRHERPLGVLLKDIAWIRPITVDSGTLAVYTGLWAEDSGQVHYQIYTEPENAEAQAIVHSQGTVIFPAAASAHYPAMLDIPGLQAKITDRISAEQCYAAFKAAGIDYGPGHQGITDIYTGQAQVLAKLLIPAAVAETQAQFILHPSIMDAALQATIGLAIGSGMASAVGPSLPFALQELEIIGPDPLGHKCVASMWAWIRYAEGCAATDKVQKLDIDLCDDHGRVCVRMRGFASRLLEAGRPNVVRAHAETAPLSTMDARRTANPGNAVSEPEERQAKAEQFFIRLLAVTLKLPAERIKADEALEKYGIDSILIIELTDVLEKTFGSLSKTLFFEYQTIRELSAYFLASYSMQMRRLLQADDGAITAEGVGDRAGSEPSAAVQHLNHGAPHTGRFITQPELANRRMLPASGALDIAIIGLAGRYPQAKDIGEYWRNLRDGKDSITEIPADRWDWRAYYTEDRSRPDGHFSKWGGFLDGVDRFDPLFFNISPREAETMDPQERLFLEQAWMALEDAGYSPEGLQKTGAVEGDDLPAQVGVYVGVMYNEYQLLGAESTLRGRPLVTGGSYAGIANRVSYLLNLHGPSMTLDTMCSSSLTSLYLACQDLIGGRTELALAGGVNVSVHANKYSMLSRGRFISSRGHCESFGSGGDGYIPGEGVGVAVLKRLADAERDGDAIYGVIKGGAINHGGKTNGYSVPNPNAQRSVIAQALKQAQVDPRAVSYIEAHGTGTKLGDPIEITGLTKAFGKHVSRHQYCRIGSAKSNIGHCESAAGIAGITKVLLQMRHAQIAPSLHSTVLNPHIDFTSAPFIVNQELRAWERPVVDGVTMPRIAGISSFGAGGSNAHLVLQEYIKKDVAQPLAETATAYAFVLSAKTEDRLDAYTGKFLAYIQSGPDISLADLSYTLQVGRQAMAERLGVIVSSMQELEEKLAGFLAGGMSGSESDIYRGRMNNGSETVSAQDMAAAIDGCNYAKLLELWVQGVAIDWHKLYETSRTPSRINLPTYPFAEERYWVDMPADDASLNVNRPFLHPLLHQNTSDLAEQRYSSTFTGQEFFLHDHRVQGQKVLPAVVYLEMAQEAVTQAAGFLEDQAQSSAGCLAVRLKNILWARPLAVDSEAQQVHTALFAEPGQAGLPEIHYEIYTESVPRDMERIVHSRGVAAFNRSLPNDGAVVLELADIRAKLEPLDAAQCYEAFSAMGIDYGPTHQGLVEIYAGDRASIGAQVLAKLVLPPTLAERGDQFILHPGIADAALQATIGLAMGAGSADNRLALPFALDELDIIWPCVATMWAWIRYADGSGPDDKVRKLDIDLADEQGIVCVRMKGFSSRMYDGPGHVSGRRDVEGSETGTLMLHPCWKLQASAQAERVVAYSLHSVLLCELDVDIQMDGVSCLSLQSDETDIDKRFQDYAVQLFEDIQGMLKSKPIGQVLFQVLIPCGDGEQQLLGGLSGMLKTAHLEYPAFIGQLIAIEPSVPGQASADYAQDIIEILKENSHCPLDHQIRYQQGKRFVACWEAMGSGSEAPVMPWKEGGIYLITGGAGGLGLIFAREIASHTRNATLILTGRSPLGVAQFNELQALGATVVYRSVDVAQKPAVSKLVRDIETDYARPLNGIIHCAGITRDSFILNKSRDALQAVLAPKVSGLVNLDQATRHLALDFFMLFSSVAGAMGNPGQADYATANAFMDNYADYRNRLAAGLASEPGSTVRPQGLTLSINWPLWKEGGMDVAAPIKDMMWRNAGLIPLETASGIRSLYQALSSKKHQIMVLEGDLTRLQAAFADQSQAASSPDAGKPQAAVEQDALQQKLIDYFKNLLSSVLKLPTHRIEADVPLETYGVDSVVVMGLTAELEKTFGSLSKTLFFEYQTVLALSRYFLESYPRQITQLPGIGDAALHQDAMPKDDTAVEPGRSRRSRFVVPPAAAVEKPPSQALAGSSDIAVIGVSGRYPDANNIAEFWNNLKAGRDSIIEIPEDRWDWQQELKSGLQGDKTGKAFCRWGGFLDGVDQFDPLFFNISPQEAEVMDPMERLFLETVWNLLESTGNVGDTLQRRYQSRVGVYVGAMYQQYHAFTSDIAKESATALSSYSAIANRVSYFFNFQGPSIAIDTMCSSSAVAVHLACESLLRGECQLAIAGGVNLSIHPKKYAGLNVGQMLGSHPNSTSFGDGDGYIPAEAVGAVLLKPLAQAIEDGDAIMAVIKATSTNHGGQANGYAVPNPHAQAQLMADNFAKAGIDPRTISYVESAANGSALGDALELSALNKVFQAATEDRRFCAIGSVKSNMGHAEAASGMSQLTKVILQLQHQQLAPSIKAEPLNPNIDFNGSPFYLQRELQEWPRPILTNKGADGYAEEREYPRRAVVNSFGAGGSNAQLIVEEFISADDRLLPIPAAGSRQLAVFSAGNPERLQAVVRQMLEYIERQQQMPLADFAYTLQVGRVAMTSRMAMVVNDPNELITKLQRYLKIAGKADNAMPDDCFTGDLDEDNTEIRQLLTGNAGQAMLHCLLAEKDLAKLGYYWTKGVTIPWHSLHEGESVRRIALPTYPFAKSRYWISAGACVPEKSPDTANAWRNDPGQSIRENMQRYLIGSLSETLNIAADAIKPNKRLQDYGVNSIIGLRLMRGFEDRFGLKISGRDLLDHPTIAALAGHFAGKADQNPFKNETVLLAMQPLLKSPLSEGQKGLWLLQKISPEMSAYNVPLAFRFQQELNIAVFRRACEFMLIRYPLLASVIGEDNGEPYQAIPAGYALCFHEEKTEDMTEEGVMSRLREKNKQPFDLQSGPLMRVHVFASRSQKPVVLISIHHIVFDGMSAVLFIQALLNAYHGYAEGHEPESAAAETGYYDFVVWEQQMLAGAEGREHLGYWQKQLAGDIPVIALPTDYPRPLVQRFNGKTYEAALKPALAQKVKALAAAQAVNLSVVFLAAFKVLLYRYSGQGDIAVGMPSLGRPQRRFEDVIGYFINMIVIRSRLSEEQTFIEVLKTLRLTVADGLDHAAYPFPALVRALKINRDAAVAPLFQVSYAYQNFASATDASAIPGIEMLSGIHQEGADDVGLEIYEEADRFIVKIDYNCDIFADATIARMMAHYIGLLEAVANAPDDSIVRHDFLSAAETQHILMEWSHVKAQTPKKQPDAGRCIHELFDEQAQKSPNQTAILFENQAISYQELNKRSTRLAKYLQKQGIKPNHLVGLCIERSPEMIIGMLGIMKAGGVYVPIDPEYPEARIKYLLEDSQAGILLTRHGIAQKMSALAPQKTCKLCLIDGQWNGITKIKDRFNRLKTQVQPKHPAYVIYTSGSTGKPKGVLVSHASIAHHCEAVKQYYRLTPDDRILQFASFSVDASLEQVLPGLISGSTVVLRDEEIWTTQMFRQKVLEYKINVVDIPPGYLHELLLASSPASVMDTLRLVITGGEVLAPQTVELWRNSPMRAIRLINAYGPTETTITSTVFDVTAVCPRRVTQTIPIGRPLADETAYILDSSGNPVAAGVAGELHIGGAGLALGYLNRPELTREKFIDDPFQPGSKMYKTGDLARWLADGTIEYLGRVDHQVKIRGFRIECGEIEAALNEQETVRNSVVLANTVNGNAQLIAYIVPVASRHSVDTAVLKKALQAKLPGYMMPSSFVLLNEIPLTPNGKLDSNALRQQAIEKPNGQRYTVPGSETEQRLAGIWQEILGVERVGVDDNFFEIGGHSLLAVRLMAAVHKAFGKDLPLSALLQNPTIAEQANRLHSGENKQWTPLVGIQVKGEQPPFFCVHAAGGNVLSYRELARQLGDQRPFYGLESPGLNGRQTPDSIEEMAALYIGAIRTVQPLGPYYLGGWSLGGIIAYEMARQLLQAGEDVALLALIESYTPDVVQAFESDYLNAHALQGYDRETLLLDSFARDLGIDERPMDSLESGGDSIERLAQVIEQTKYLNQPSSEPHAERIERLFNVFKANTLAMNGYRPQPYEGRITFFCTDKAVDAGWSGLAESGVEIINVPGNHYTILHEKNAEFLANELKKYL